MQCGFGRVGLQYWAYHTAGVIPDIVTLAKSMGNGVPMGGVVVREDVATIFDSQGMEYFSTCGEMPLIPPPVQRQGLCGAVGFGDCSSER